MEEDKNIEYRIGACEVDEEYFNTKYIVEKNNNILSIFIPNPNTFFGQHSDIADKFSLDHDKIIGGGRIVGFCSEINNAMSLGFIRHDKEKREKTPYYLWIGDASGSYGRVDEEIMLKFGELILSKLENDGLLDKLAKEEGVKVKGVKYFFS